MQDNIREIQENISDFARKVLEESRSNVQKAEKDLSSFVKRFVDNGKMAPIDGDKIITKLNQRIQKRRDEFERLLDDGSRWTLNRISIPTQDEVEKLSGRIDKLSKRIGNLKKELSS